MGKKSGSSSSSWLTAVKRAFRSPTKKEHNNNNINAHGNEAEEDDDKVCLKYLSLVSSLSLQIWTRFLLLFKCSVFFFQKREKRRWLFRKTTNHDSPAKTTGVVKDGSAPKPVETAAINTNASSSVSEQRNAAPPPPTTVSIVSELPPATAELPSISSRSYSAREIHAAIIIQTCFRGYLVSKLSTNYC